MSTIEEVRTVTADGRIVIPWEIQEALGLTHGGSIRFRFENGIVTLHPAGDPMEEAAFMAFIVGGPEGQRQAADELRIELTALLDYSVEDCETGAAFP